MKVIIRRERERENSCNKPLEESIYSLFINIIIVLCRLVGSETRRKLALCIQVLKVNFNTLKNALSRHAISANRKWAQV